MMYPLRPSAAVSGEWFLKETPTPRQLAGLVVAGVGITPIGFGLTVMAYWPSHPEHGEQK